MSEQEVVEQTPAQYVSERLNYYVDKVRKEQPDCVVRICTRMAQHYSNVVDVEVHPDEIVRFRRMARTVTLSVMKGEEIKRRAEYNLSYFCGEVSIYSHDRSVRQIVNIRCAKGIFSFSERAFDVQMNKAVSA